MTYPRALTRAEFRRCFAESMRDMTGAAQAVTDIWPYVDGLDALAEGVARIGDVAHIYRDGSCRYDHVLLETDRANVFLVIVVDLGARDVLGHHLLDLDIEYGLAAEH
jgi:hypothetical protein